MRRPTAARQGVRRNRVEPISKRREQARVVLVVNTAGYCGFTRQYEPLEALYARYAPQGLTVLGFPSNDFGRQQPGTKEDIAALCFNTYRVNFPMFSKIKVVGGGVHPLYTPLAQTSGQPPRWNLHNYLLDRKGQVVASFASEINPLDTRITQRVEALLQSRDTSAKALVR
jgi:glutathione peroxidase